jgi:hypothetical protein
LEEVVDARRTEKIRALIAKEAARRGQKRYGVWFSGLMAEKIGKQVMADPLQVMRIAKVWTAQEKDK